MTESLTIREALPTEASLLSDLAFRSKSHWGYSVEFMESCRAELTIDPAEFSDVGFLCFVATSEDSILGFYSLRSISEQAFELDALFVEPEHIGHGVGRSLVQHAVRLLSQRGAACLVIQGDPNATEFYHAAGARQVGVRESGSISGRFLPLFEIDL